MACGSCGGGSPRPRPGTTPRANEYPTHQGFATRDQMWHVWFPGAPEPTQFTHEWQANAARMTAGGGTIYPPGTLPAKPQQEGSPT